MTSSSTPRIVPNVSYARPLSAELIDTISDVILSAPDQLTRSAVIAELVHEIYESVAWLYADPYYEELVSLRRLRDEAKAHRQRLALMAGFQFCTGTGKDLHLAPTVGCCGAEQVQLDDQTEVTGPEA